MHRWKFEETRRIVYALVFEETDGARRCYIGQSMNFKARIRTHKKEWHAPFQVFQLGEVFGHYWLAANEEWAWRTSALLDGWEVFSFPGTIIDPLEHVIYTHDWVFDHLEDQAMVGLEKRGVPPTLIPLPTPRKKAGSD